MDGELVLCIKIGIVWIFPDTDSLHFTGPVNIRKRRSQNLVELKTCNSTGIIPINFTTHWGKI